MKTGRAYVLKTTPPIPEEDAAAARRMIARRAENEAERAELEAMLGVAS